MNLARLLFVVILSACSQIHPVPVSVNVSAAKNLNSRAGDASLPVRLTLYQLSDARAFEEATFRQLWKQDGQTLGDSLLSKKEFTVAPNSQTTLTLSRQQGASYIAVMALFRQPAISHWRAIKPLPGQAVSLVQAVSIGLRGNRVELK